VGNFISKALLTHAQVIDDEGKVLINTVEVLELLTHLVSLLIQLLDFNFTGSNVTLEFLDLIIKYELEFFKLLSFLL